MPDLFSEITDILTQPYGSLAYHLVLSFIYIGTLYPALVFSSEEKRSRQRMLIGISGLLLSQIIIFITSAFVILGFSGLELILPVLDRVTAVINIAIITWLFAYVNSDDRRIDIGIAIVLFFIMAGGGISMFYWASIGSENTFIQSQTALSWNIAAAGLAVIGEMLIFRSSSKTGNWGLTILFLIFAGEITNIAMLSNTDPNSLIVGDYSVILRLTYLIAMPLLYGISGSLVSQVTHTKMIVTSIPDSPPPPTLPNQDKQNVQLIENGAQEQTRGIDLHLFQNTMTLAASTDYQDVCHLFTRYTAHALVSDICLLLSPPDDNDQVHLISAYDLIVQESFSPLAFDHHLIPGYKAALASGEPLQVSDDTSSQISSFAHLILVDRIFSMLIYPIVGSQGESIAAICLISPYSKYVWTEEEYYYLQDSSGAIAAVLERALNGTEPEPSPAIESLTEQLENSELERSQLVAQMEALSGELAALSMLAEEAPQDTEENNKSEEQLAALSASLEVLESENEALKQQISALDEQTNQYLQTIAEMEEDANTKLQTIAELEEQAVASPKELEDLSTKLQEALKRAGNFEHQLHQAQAQLEFLDHKAVPIPSDGSALPTEQAEVIASIAQELRQPMSSISGYTDLLISESVGILGALQKKFLERVKASTDRMNHLIGDLIQITTLDSGNLAFTPQPVEVIEIVDQAIEITSGQFREKDIALRVDINPHLPKMHTDKDALQQILLHLLQNAGAATPEEGEIHVKIEPYNKTDNDIILIAVTDSGEGIPREDLPRVFSRLYRADNPLIPGVGDTGVGLSIAKTLAEALGGRIWVESDQGTGSTFSVLLPITTQTVSAAEG